MRIGKLALTAMFSVLAFFLAQVWTVEKPLAGVFTWRYDNSRMGSRGGEDKLSPDSVQPQRFGKMYSYAVDGAVYAQPLLVYGLDMPGIGPRNVALVATEHNSVYAFDADGKTFAPLWHTTFLTGPDVGPVPQSDTGGTISPEIGITSTPVIDPDRLTLYAVAYSKESGEYKYRLHALDLRTGAERKGGPVTIAGFVHGSGYGSRDGGLQFDAKIQLQRAALLLDHGTIYIAFASHADLGPFHGWLFAYDALSLRQKAVWVSTPDGLQGGIWQSGAGPAADPSGAVYLGIGNGTFDGDQGGRNYANSVVKMRMDGDNFLLGDYFTPFNYAELQRNDTDLGSGGPVLLPGQHSTLLTTVGKEGRIYLLDADHMGQLAPDDRQIPQSIPDALGADDQAGFRSFTTPAFWQGMLYFAGSRDHLTAFRLENDRLSRHPVSRSAHRFPYPGATPVVTGGADGSAVVWAVEWRGPQPAVLHAYDAADLANELFNTEICTERDRLAPGVKWAVPIVFGGKVFLGGVGRVDVLGPVSPATPQP